MSFDVSPYPEVNRLAEQRTRDAETVPPAERCAQGGWRPHSFQTEGVCSWCRRTREQIAEEK